MRRGDYAYNLLNTSPATEREEQRRRSGSSFRYIDTEYRVWREETSTVQQHGLGRELVSETTDFAAC